METEPVLSHHRGAASGAAPAPDGPEAQLDFPILEELSAQRASDYLAFVVPFDPDYREGIIGSWTTDRGDGFSDEEVRALARIQTRLAVACKVKIQAEISRNVVNAYLGPQTGSLVLSGTIKRGDGERTEAVIWYSDLRRSTELIERLSVERFLDLLNRYFDCTAGAVRAQGGEVVTLVGDAVLALFRADGGETLRGAGRRALCAARQAEARLGEVNRELARSGLAPLRFGVALHLGEVIYGNIGTSDRLEFTVVGPAVKRGGADRDADQGSRPYRPGERGVRRCGVRRLGESWTPRPARRSGRLRDLHACGREVLGS